jgi:hypothetical protein
MALKRGRSIHTRRCRQSARCQFQNERTMSNPVPNTIGAA